MRHSASPRFWRCHESLPASVQALANKNFQLLKADPRHPSLHFKRIEALWSVRVGAQYRALGVDHGAGILWFWIGSHAEYDKLHG